MLGEGEDPPHVRHHDGVAVHVGQGRVDGGLPAPVQPQGRWRPERAGPVPALAEGAVGTGCGALVPVGHGTDDTGTGAGTTAGVRPRSRQAAVAAPARNSGTRRNAVCGPTRSATTPSTNGATPKARLDAVVERDTARSGCPSECAISSAMTSGKCSALPSPSTTRPAIASHANGASQNSANPAALSASAPST